MDSEYNDKREEMQRIISIERRSGDTTVKVTEGQEVYVRKEGDAMITLFRPSLWCVPYHTHTVSITFTILFASTIAHGLSIIDIQVMDSVFLLITMMEPDVCLCGISGFHWNLRRSRQLFSSHIMVDCFLLAS